MMSMITLVAEVVTNVRGSSCQVPVIFVLLKADVFVDRFSPNSAI